MRALIGVASCVLAAAGTLSAQVVPGVPPATDVLYAGTSGSGATGGVFGTIDSSTADWTTIGDPTTNGPLPALARDSSGRFFATNNPGGSGSAATLIRIDKLTGALISTIGPVTDLGDAGALRLSDMSFQPGTDVLFGMCSTTGKAGKLYTVDVTTAEATLVGDTGLAQGGLAFAPDGTLWLATNFGGGPVLAQIDPATAGVIGSTLPLADSVDALAVRPSDSVLFGKESDSNNLFTIDTTDGSETPIGTVSSPPDSIASMTFAPGAATTVDSYFLPRVVSVKFNSKTPAKSRLVCAGFFDLGPDPVDLSLGATVDVGGYEVTAPALVPNAKGTVFKLKQAGLLMAIKPDKSGSSRALFTLKVQDDLAGLIDPDGVLVLHFKSAAVDGEGAVTLEQGKYKLGKKRGELIEPAIYLFKVRGKLVGKGQDGLLLKAGMSTDGTTPDTPPDLALDFGDGFTAAVPFLDWVPKGDSFSVKNVDGLSSAVLDYLRETVTAKAKAVDLGPFVDGPQEVDVTIGLGADVRTVAVRMVRKGKLLKY